MHVHIFILVSSFCSYVGFIMFYTQRLLSCAPSMTSCRPTKSLAAFSIAVVWSFIICKCVCVFVANWFYKFVTFFFKKNIYSRANFQRLDGRQRCISWRFSSCECGQLRNKRNLVECVVILSFLFWYFLAFDLGRTQVWRRQIARQLCLHSSDTRNQIEQLCNALTVVPCVLCCV